jgi:DNA replication and repair protein RecF
MASLFPVVLFSPESLAAIKDGPDQRRQLIDNVLVTQSERDARLIREFQKSLRSRNALLKQISEGDRRATTLGALESITKLFLLLATQLTEARLLALRALQPGFCDTAGKIFSGQSILEPLKSNQARHEFSFVYEISGKDALSWGADQIFDAISHRHRELESREMESGTSLIGPQKHDFRIELDKNDSRYYGSQGQQRALILAFKIAQINLHQMTLGRYPVLLLDDVMSELDSDKRGRLMEYLEQTRAQVLITATDLTWSERFSNERNAVFTVEDGIVTLATSSAIRAVGTANMLEDAST